MIGIIAVLIGVLLPTLAKAAGGGDSDGVLEQPSAGVRRDDAVRAGQPVSGAGGISHRVEAVQQHGLQHDRGSILGAIRADVSSGDDDCRVLYCPAENNSKFMFNTLDNPWPASPIVPSANIQAGYCFRPLEQIPDDLTVIPAALKPFALPKLNNLGNRAILADLTASYTRVVTRHTTGINVLYGNGSCDGCRSKRSNNQPPSGPTRHCRPRRHTTQRRTLSGQCSISSSGTQQLLNLLCVLCVLRGCKSRRERREEKKRR